MAIEISRGQISSTANPLIDIYLTRAGIPFRPLSLAFAIWSTAGAAAQTYPVGGGTQAVDLDDDALNVGRYVAAWTVPANEPLGAHEIRWTFVEAAGIAAQSFTEAFTVGSAVVAQGSASRGYCTIEDCRAEGMPLTTISDDRLRALIEECSREIDAWCRQWFEPRYMTLLLDGGGTSRLYTPAPVIRIDSVVADAITYDAADAVSIEGAPRSSTLFEDLPGFRWSEDATTAVRWPKRRQAVTVTGVFGYTEADGSAFGRTPLAIKRATIMLVALRRAKIATMVDGGGGGGIGAGGVLSIRTKTQMVTWGERPTGDAPFTGNADLDTIIKRYRRREMGSV